MFGSHEILVLLFSISEMMLTVSLKPYIVQKIRRQCLHSGCYDGERKTLELDDSAGNFSETLTGRQSTVLNNSMTADERIVKRERAVAGASDDETELEAKVGTYLMIDVAGTYIPWTVFAPLFGAWSDKYGRKLVLFVPPVGHVISVVVYLAMGVHGRDNLLATVIVGAVLRGVSGKHALFSVVMYSIASDTSSVNERSARFASLIATRFIGLCAGALGAGVLQDIVGVSYTMVTSSAFQAFVTLLIVFTVRETLPPSAPTGAKDHRTSCWQVAADYIRKAHACCGCGKSCEDNVLKDGTTAGLLGKEKQEEKGEEVVEAIQRKEATNVGRTQVKVAIITMSFLGQSLWACQRELIVQSVTVPPLSWPDSWFGYLTAMYYGASGVVLLLMVPCLVRLLPSAVDPDVTVLVLSLVSGAVCSLWTGLAIQAVSSWQVFTAYIFGALGPSSNASLRSMMSRCVGSESQGKALAVQSALENIAKVLGPILHTAIYVTTLSVSTSFVYYVMAAEAVLLLPLVFVIAKSV